MKKTTLIALIAFIPCLVSTMDLKKEADIIYKRFSNKLDENTITLVQKYLEESSSEKPKLLQNQFLSKVISNTKESLKKDLRAIAPLIMLQAVTSGIKKATNNNNAGQAITTTFNRSLAIPLVVLSADIVGKALLIGADKITR